MDRIIIEAILKPLFSTIQPASFVDVGHSLYVEPLSNQQCLIVDTPQSVANYLEAVSWNDLEQKLAKTLTGLPYIEVINKGTGKVVASSLTLNHRLGSGYLALHVESPLKEILIREIDVDGLYETLFKYDPNSIIHGCFINRIGGDRVHRVPRLLTGRIEAKNVVAVQTGGASKDPLSASGKEWDMSFFEKEKSNDGDKTSAYGLGNLPYHQQEYACELIAAKFIINCHLIEATGLPTEAQNLLAAMAEWKVLKFLQSSIRLRTTEYECGEITGGTKELDLLEKEIPKLIKACTKKGYFAKPVITQVSLTLQPPPSKPKSKPKSKNKSTNDSQKQEEDSCSQLKLNY